MAAGAVVAQPAVLRPERDLQWTGSHFLDPQLIASKVAQQAAQVDFTRRGSPTSEPLRGALAQYHGIDPSWVAIGVGSSQLLDVVLDHLRIARVFEVVPNFPLLRRAAGRRGLAYQPLWVRNPGDLASAYPTGAHADSLLALSSPRNPQGYAFPPEDLIDLMSWFPGYLLVDEAYADFATHSVLHQVRVHHRLLVLRTFSKAWGLANLRIGYLVSRAVDTRLWERLLPHNVGELSQRVACDLLADPGVVHSAVSRTRAARWDLQSALSQLPAAHAWPSESNFVSVELPQASALVRRAREYGYLLGELHQLPFYPTDWPNGLRISATPAAIQEPLLRFLGETVSEVACLPEGQGTPHRTLRPNPEGA